MIPFYEHFTRVQSVHSYFETSVPANHLALPFSGAQVDLVSHSEASWVDCRGWRES